MKSKTARKPWGNENIVKHKSGTQFKIITVKEGEMTSLQYHNFKDEVIFALSDFELVIGLEQKICMSKGDMYVLPATHVHRFMATQGCDAVIAEMSNGKDSDIVRLADKYGRKINEAR